MTLPFASHTIEQIAPSRLKPWARNARTHSKKQIRQIADSIRTFGFTNPVLIDAANTILAGHGRVEAAKLDRHGRGALRPARVHDPRAEARLRASPTTSWR